MAPRLSIIIPAYNCADYLGQCLDSIGDPGGAGPGDDVEVVVVDDGSTDATGRIVRARALADPRIRHLRQDNRGVSAARNAGIGAARGRCLMFVDADDALAAGWWDAVRPHLEGGEDIVCFLAGAERERYTPDELVRATIGGPGAPPLAWPAPPWAKLYRADLLAARGARFAPDIMYGEDALFNLGLYASGARCRFVAASVYRYRLRPGSTTRSYDERFVESNERYLRALEKILIDCGRYPRPVVTELVDASFVRSVTLAAVRIAGLPRRGDRRAAIALTRRNAAFARRLARVRRAPGAGRLERFVYALTRRAGPGPATALLRPALRLRPRRRGDGWAVI